VRRPNEQSWARSGEAIKSRRANPQPQQPAHGPDEKAEGAIKGGGVRPRGLP
jgi:hypothetical protein